MTKVPAFTDWLQKNARLVEAQLSALIEPLSSSAALMAAMKYSTLNGGKRLRPAVLFAVAEEDGTLPDSALMASCAVELIHCYSLVHDDMPCMDDDALRRGKPACHKAHGEGMALLAGDCLQSLAFEALARAALPPAALHQLASAAGAAGMGGGQALDITTDISNETELETMHRLKTGALFDCALQLGLLCRTSPVGANEQNAINCFSREFGLLFQIANDLQDQARDQRAGKVTYATLLPLEKARARADLAKTRTIAAVENLFPRLADITRAIY